MPDVPATLDEKTGYIQDTLVVLAREIATNIFPLQTILERHRVTPERWLEIQKDPRFSQILEAEILAWGSALNTEARTKLKAATIIEEYLPEAARTLDNISQPLASRVELAKLVARIAGIGVAGMGVDGAVDRFAITINLGADANVKFEGQMPSKVIDAVALE